MPDSRPTTASRLITAGILSAVLIQAVNGYLAYRAAQDYFQAAETRRQSFHVLQTATLFLSQLKDAETGARGYLLTGDAAYLEPYEAAMASAPALMQHLTQACAATHADDLAAIRDEYGRLFDRLRKTIADRSRAGSTLDAQQTAVDLTAAKGNMDAVRRRIDDIETAERERLSIYTERMDRLSQTTLTQVLAASTLAVVLVVVAGLLLYRDMLRRIRLYTELRTQGSTLHSILESMGEGVIVADPAGKIQLANAAARRIHGRDLTGLRREEWASTLSLLRSDQVTLYAADDLPLSRALRGETVDGAELFCRSVTHPNGIFLGISARPINDEAGKLLGGVIVLRDITSQKQQALETQRMNELLEQRVLERTADLARTNNELQQKSQENELFVYSVSHDLRSPLVNLEGYSRELTRSCLELQTLFAAAEIPPAIADRGKAVLADDVGVSIGFIQTAVDRLANIINALLRLSRAGRVEYTWQRFSLDEIIHRARVSLHQQCTRADGAINTQLLGDAWGDAAAVETLFANLLENAIKYRDPKRRLQIDVGRDDAPVNGVNHDKMVRLFVRDNGLGIPAGGREKIFKAFERLHPSVAAGEGMGLAIVQRIVNRHGGKIEIESQVGIGTTFYITLPTERTDLIKTQTGT